MYEAALPYHLKDLRQVTMHRSRMRLGEPKHKIVVPEGIITSMAREQVSCTKNFCYYCSQQLLIFCHIFKQPQLHESKCLKIHVIELSGTTELELLPAIIIALGLNSFFLIFYFSPSLSFC